MGKKKIAKKKVVKKKVSRLSKDPVYVQLLSPVYHRKKILRCAIESARLLQSYEDIRALRKEKEDVLKQFLKVVGDAKKRYTHLVTKVLPKVKEDKPKKATPVVKVKKVVSKPKMVSPKPVAPVMKQKPRTEVERLQDELEDIESRLSKL